MRICIISYGFNKANIFLQPWRYLYEISIFLRRKGHEIVLLSNEQYDDEVINGVQIYYKKNLKGLFVFKNHELLDFINNYSPNVIFFPLGMTSVFHYSTFKNLKTPIIGLWLGTSYPISVILQLGFKEIIQNFGSLYTYLIEGCIPNYLISKFLNFSCFKKIIVQNSHNLNFLKNVGVDSKNIELIPAGVDDPNPKYPTERGNSRENFGFGDKDFILLYLGSSLSLRGVDLVVKSVNVLEKKIPTLKIVILSRSTSNNYIRNNKRLKRLKQYRQHRDKISIITGILNRSILNNYILSADIILLPFKIVQADNPTSILEVMAFGKPVISTNIDGIPDLLNSNRGLLVKPNNINELSQAIIYLYENPSVKEEIGIAAQNYISQYRTWTDIGENFMDLLNRVIVK